MKRSRRLAVILVALMVLTLFPMSAFAGASLNLKVDFSPAALSGPGGVNYQYRLSNTGSAAVTNIQLSADGVVIDTISRLERGESKTGVGYVVMGEGDIGRNIRFIAQGYAQTSSGSGGIGSGASMGTKTVSAVCDTQVQRAGNVVPVIGGGTQPVPVIGGGAQPVPTIGGGAQPIPTIGGGVQPVPTIGGSAQPVPTIGGGAQPLPVINGVTKVTATASASSKVINVGDDCTVSVTANNCGTNNVSNVKIMIDNIVYARSGSLPAGQAATYRFDLPISGPVSFQPVICYTGPDGNEIAQKLNAISISCPSNDLAISVQASTTNPGPYEDVVFHLTLTNNGNDVIQRVQLYDCDHQAIGGPLDALYPRQVVEADLEAPIHLATNIVFYVEALEGGGRVAAQSNVIKIIPSIR